MLIRRPCVRITDSHRDLHYRLLVRPGCEADYLAPGLFLFYANDVAVCKTDFYLEANRFFSSARSAIVCSRPVCEAVFRFVSPPWFLFGGAKLIR